MWDILHSETSKWNFFDGELLYKILQLFVKAVCQHVLLWSAQEQEHTAHNHHLQPESYKELPTHPH